MSTVSDEQILDYLDGEADEPTIEAVERAIKEDPEVHKTAELMRLSKAAVQDSLREPIKPPEDFVNKLKTMEKEYQSRLESHSTKRFLSWRPVAKAANSNQFRMLIAACFALVFIVSQDVVQIAEQPWEGTISTNSLGNKSAPKTRSLAIKSIPIKEISFTPTTNKSVKLVVAIYDNQQSKTPLKDDMSFVLYKNWFKTLSGYFGLVPGNVLKIGIGQSIQLSITSIVAGKVSLKAVQDNGPQYSFFENAKASKNQILKTDKLTAEPPTDTGRFILEFTADDGKMMRLIVPFELAQAEE